MNVFKTGSDKTSQSNRYGEVTKISVPSVAKMYDDGSDGMSSQTVAGLASGGGLLCKYCTNVTVTTSIPYRAVNSATPVSRVPLTRDTPKTSATQSITNTTPVRPPTVIVIFNQYNYTSKQSIKHY